MADLWPTYAKDGSTDLHSPRDGDKIINAPELTLDTVSNLQISELDKSIFVRTNKIDLLGYNTVGDGGGGQLYWNADRDKQDHNGGTVFSPTWNNGTFGDTTDANWYSADGTDTGSGCWIRPEKTYILLEEWGAAGNGSTDDQNAFDAALLYASNRGGMKFDLSPKTYVLGTGNITDYSGCSFIGESISSTTLEFTNLSNDAFQITDNNESEVYFDKLSISGSDRTGRISGSAFHFIGSGGSPSVQSFDLGKVRFLRWGGANSAVYFEDGAPFSSHWDWVIFQGYDAPAFDLAHLGPSWTINQLYTGSANNNGNPDIDITSPVSGDFMIGTWNIGSSSYAAADFTGFNAGIIKIGSINFESFETGQDYCVKISNGKVVIDTIRLSGTTNPVDTVLIDRGNDGKVYISNVDTGSNSALNVARNDADATIITDIPEEDIVDNAGRENTIFSVLQNKFLDHPNRTQFADGDATPSVADDVRIYESRNLSSPTTIINFDDTYEGQVIYLYIRDDNTTIQNNSNIELQGGIDFSGSEGDIITFVSFVSGVVSEISRSINSS